MIANTLCTHVVGLFRHCVYGNRLPGKFVVPDLRTVWWIHASEVGVSTHQCSIIVCTSYMYLNNQPQSAMCRKVIRHQMCSLVNAANNITCVESIHWRDKLQLIEEFKNAQATRCGVLCNFVQNSWRTVTIHTFLNLRPYWIQKPMFPFSSKPFGGHPGYSKWPP